MLKQNNWVVPSHQGDELDEKIVQIIVARLGYTDAEVRKYVRKDKNSFVGVLYHKLVNDQREK